MRRYGFCDFLNSRINRLDKTYEADSVNGAVSHCRIMQLAFGDDLDAVISDSARLETLYNNPATQVNYKWALQLYEAYFQSYPINWQHSSSNPLTRGKDRALCHVHYDEAVPAHQQIPGLCVQLESAYVWILDFAKALFDTLLEDSDYRYIPVVLSLDIPADRKFPVSEKYYRELVKRQEKCERLTDVQKNILEERVIRTPILGEFTCNPEPKITLYYNAAAGCADYAQYISTMVNCLAHEYMHYLHYSRCLSYGMFYFFDNDALSEAMADFFGVLFSLSRKNGEDFHFAKERYFLWNDLLDAGWPYAYAKCFYTAGRKDLPFSVDIEEYYRHGSPQKLRKVLEDCPDLGRAYNRLKNGCACP